MQKLQMAMLKEYEMELFQHKGVWHEQIGTCGGLGSLFYLDNYYKNLKLLQTCLAYTSKFKNIKSNYNFQIDEMDS